MRIIDTFRYGKEVVFFIIIILLFVSLVLHKETRDEISHKNTEISKLKDEISVLQKELQRQSELYTISEELREEMQGVIEELEGEKEDNSQFISDASNKVEQMKNNQEGMVKVINNGTQLVEAIDKHIRTYNNWGVDDMTTENSWKKVEKMAECYSDSVNDLKFGRLVSNCF